MALAVAQFRDLSREEFAPSRAPQIPPADRYGATHSAVVLPGRYSNCFSHQTLCLATMQSERTSQSALHCCHRYGKHLRDLVWLHFFFVAQHNNHSGLMGKRSDHLPQRRREQRVGVCRSDCRLLNVFQSYGMAPIRRPGVVERSMRDHSAQPKLQVVRRFQPWQLVIQLQEHVLGEFFGGCSIVQKAISDAEHHRLVLPNQINKSLPAKLHPGNLPASITSSPDTYHTTCR